jgi:glucan phosphoethanolaminetransferase (alkaline phosphatase superfamily)
MNFETMSKQRKIILVASAVGFIAMFLPWINISFFGISSSLNGMHDKGILVFICFVVSGVLTYTGDHTKNLGKTNWFIVLMAGALATLIMLWYIIDASESFAGSLFSIGFYLTSLAAIVVLIAAYFYKSPGDSIKGGFDNLKNSIESKTKSKETSL